jgi:hypothetical protein
MRLSLKVVVQNDRDFVDIILLYTSTDIRAIKLETRRSAGHGICIINDSVCLNAYKEGITGTWAEMGEY